LVTCRISEQIRSDAEKVLKTVQDSCAEVLAIVEERSNLWWPIMDAFYFCRDRGYISV